MPRRRTVLKWMHWAMGPMLIWFILMTPDDVLPLGLFGFHSALALVFVTVCLAWTGMHLRKGLASRPGPKLPGWARVVHQVMHQSIIWGLFLVAFTGFLLGLTSSRLLKAGGFLPIAPPMDWPKLNEWIGAFHIFEFYLLGVIVAFHAGFHLWRHYRLRDNALRIMAPRALHRFL